jgi:hypothetical protein
MKTLIIASLVLILTSFSYAQTAKGDSFGKGANKTEALPEIVINSAKADMLVYVPDSNPDARIVRIQEKFMAHDIGKDYQGFEEYLVTMETPTGQLLATYNEKGKLISVDENYKNVILPAAVVSSILNDFPGWRIVNDKFTYSQAKGQVTKKHYAIGIVKDNDKRKLIMSPNGDLLK